MIGMGAGGTGGGGTGGSTPSRQGTSGTAYTGGGAGGPGSDGTTSVNGNNGGSGIVILKYSDGFKAAVSTTGSPEIVVTGGYRYYTFKGNGTVVF
jgi:hypothetical protein